MLNAERCLLILSEAFSLSSVNTKPRKIPVRTRRCCLAHISKQHSQRQHRLGWGFYSTHSINGDTFEKGAGKVCFTFPIFSNSRFMKSFSPHRPLHLRRVTATEAGNIKPNRTHRYLPGHRSVLAVHGQHRICPVNCTAKNKFFSACSKQGQKLACAQKSQPHAKAADSPTDGRPTKMELAFVLTGVRP